VDVPEREGDDAKEVFAFFGLAAYYAQVLEQELLLFASMLNLSGQTALTPAVVGELFARLEARTLGQLVREARQLTTIPLEVEVNLSRALRERNRLAHTFFAEHAQEFMSAGGRIRMIDELRAATEQFQAVDRAITALREPLSTRLGITKDVAQREFDRLVRAAADV